ncbi:L-fucose mutarotase [Pseudovibrio denitrificans]|uniref:L-fucose mutarotase n=1 Tax=Pseudovibrio denitrificans TaxID=258256 RepID=A0A1I7DFQ0_9HYPH|nr:MULTISPECIES: L-fucose mutarotase [Pseudovibrio]SFU10499.1 L-fucose mutarotase [Pseudovibrio denitrificans]
MLKGINPIIFPELLKILHEMGHGDELVLSDAHFPAYSVCDKVLRADGCEATDLLQAIMPLWELDQYDPENVMMMAAVEGDQLPDGLVDDYQNALPAGAQITFVERFAFYEKAKKAYCVVVTGTTRKYGNVIIKKGVIQG